MERQMEIGASMGVVMKMTQATPGLQQQRDQCRGDARVEEYNAYLRHTYH